MSTLRHALIALAVGALSTTAAVAAGMQADAATPPASGALPGDDALTCEQIYAQGMAESQRAQQARAQRNDQRRAELSGMAALITGAALTGGMGGTGPAANAAAEAQANKAIAESATPPSSNARLERLKQLWAQKHCVAK